MVVTGWRQFRLPSMSKKNTSSSDSADSSSLTFKQKTGDAANRWLERNRNLALRQTPVWAQSMAALIASLGIIAVAGGIFFKIDEVVTVQGQLLSIGGTVEVKTPVGGRIAKVFFKDGDYVNPGQLLVKFDTRKAADEKSTIESLILLEQNELESRIKTFSSQEATLRGKVEVIEQKLKTKKTITDELKVLVDAGGFQKLQYLEQLDSVFELQKTLSEVDEQRNQLKLATIQVRLEAEKNIGQMRNKIREADLQLQYQNVVAPIGGIVFDPQVGAEGVLGSGERILSLVPQVGLSAEVFVPNKDIGFVKKGQKAKVRVDAFPFTRYGELSGEVAQIAADALPPDTKHPFYRFPVKLRLGRSYLESRGVKLPLQSGMAITTNLKLREKRVISLISDVFSNQVDSVKSLRQ